MKDNRDNSPPNMPVDILKNVGEIIRHVSPDLLVRLGGIATEGATAEDQVWMDGLADVAQTIQTELNTIFTAINETTPVPIESVAPESVVTPEVIELDELEEEIFAYAKENDAFRIEALKKAIPSLANADPKTYRSFKHRFARIRERIAEKSKQQAEPGNWIEGDGVKRAKTYEFVLDGQEPNGVRENPNLQRAKTRSKTKPERLQKTAETSTEPIEPNETTTEEATLDQRALPAEETVDLRGITEKGLSPNEQQAIRQAVAFLQGFEERKSLRDIISAVFGRSRLPRDEEARMIQILDTCVSLGMLRSYGKSYGYKSSADQAIANEVQSPADTGEELNDIEQAYLEYIRTYAENGEMHIGKVVRGYLGEKRVGSDQFRLMINTLNSLANRGYLVHANNSPWYGLPKTASHSQQASEVRSIKILADIKTPVTNVLPTESVLHSLAEEEVISLQDTPATKPEPRRKAERKTKTTDEANGLGIDLSSYGLSDREIRMTVAIVSSVTPGEWFKQSETDLGSIPFKSDSARSKAYGMLTQKLVEADLLIDNGKARGGKKYQLGEKLLSLIDDANRASTQAVAEQQPDHKASNEPKADSAPKYFETVAAGRAKSAEPLEEPLSAREEQARFRRAASFTITLTNNIDRDLIESSDDQAERFTKAVEYIADGLGIAKDVAGIVLKSLIDKEHYYATTDRGMKMLSKLPPQNGDRITQTEKRASAEQERLMSLKETHGPAILAFLSGLIKDQTEYKTSIANAVEGLMVDDVNAVCNLLLADGLVWSKALQSRGSGRKRKGKTWAITDKGLQFLADRESGLSDAEKRKILSGFRH